MRGEARKVLAVRFSDRELADLKAAFKRDTGGRSKHGHYGLATWIRRAALQHARQLNLLEQRNTLEPRNTPAAGAIARNTPPAGGAQ